MGRNRSISPYLDLATIFIFYDINTEDRKIFLNTYGSDVNLEALEAAYKIMNYAYALRLWWTSFRSHEKGNTPKIENEANLKKLVDTHKWDQILPQLGSNDAAYTVSRLLLNKI